MKLDNKIDLQVIEFRSSIYICDIANPVLKLILSSLENVKTS